MNLRDIQIIYMERYMAVVEWKKEQSIAIIYMCNGPNKQDPEFAVQLTTCLDDILEDENITAVILTSTDEKNFSQGIDTDWLAKQMADGNFDSVSTFLHDMNAIFKCLLTMPIPVIAAINGHAFGNGAMLACACDFRFMREDKGFFCFPEVDISIPFLPGMIKLARKAIPEHVFNEMTLTGRRMNAQDLEKAKVLKKACEDNTSLQKTSTEFANAFNKKREIFSELKTRMHIDIVKTMETEDVKKIDSLDIF